MTAKQAFTFPGAIPIKSKVGSALTQGGWSLDVKEVDSFEMWRS